jgi:protein involved in polysaccharide export with SLBB domain
MGLMLGAAWIIAAGGCAQHATGPATSAPSQAGNLAAAAKTMAVVVGDVDHDGHPDVVAGAVDPGLIAISYGDGRGGLSAPQLVPAEGDVHGVAVADVNEDGMPDIVYSVQRQSSGIRLLLNQGNRRWQPAKGPIEINKYEGVQAVDLNADGHADIIAANSSSEPNGGIQVWYGTGLGSWTAAAGPTVTGVYMDVAVADFNADGIPDLAGAGWGTHGALQVWLGSGNGQWTALAPVAAGNFYALSVADLDQNGHLDILAGTYQSGVRLFYNDGFGGFLEQTKPEAAADDASSKADAGSPLITDRGESSFWQVLPVDLDGDGWLDIVAASLDFQGVKAWRNQAGRGWKPHPGNFPRTGNYYGMAAADLNGDGRPDICAASYGGGVNVWSGHAGRNVAAAPLRRPEDPPAEVSAEAAVIRENAVFKTINGSPEYKIGPGDLLEVTFWEGHTATRQEILVRPDGRISFGLLEDLTVAGLTASELDELLTSRLEQYFKRPRLDVLVKQYHSKSVRLLGALQHTGLPDKGPGEYKLRGKSTVLEMITVAGGPTADADLKSVRIRRRNGETVSLNLYKTIIQGDTSQDLVLNDGDLVYLSTLSKEANRVYVFGEVPKPGAYTFSGSEMRLIDAISEAGGTTAFAARAETKVVRGDITQPEILNADLTRLVEKGDRSQNLLLASGDMVYVPRSGFGDIKLFYDRVRPLLELVLWPARVVIDWNSATDITGVK